MKPSSVEARKKALVIEGGGMRSAYAAGVLLAFHDHNFNSFDIAVGSSAGACCAANFVAGEPEKNRTILEDHLTSRNFVNLGNLFSRKNILDIDFLIDEVCVKQVPLNIEKIRNSPTRLFITATDYLTGRLVYFNNREDNIHEALRASCAMPFLYKKQAVYQNRRYLDGGLVASIPFEKAIEEKCDEVVVISTRAEGYFKKPSRIPPLFYRLTYAGNRALRDLFRNRHQIYNETLSRMEKTTSCKVHLIQPQSPLPVTRTTKDRRKVRAAVEIGYSDGQKFLTRPL